MGAGGRSAHGGRSQSIRGCDGAGIPCGHPSREVGLETGHLPPVGFRLLLVEQLLLSLNRQQVLRGFVVVTGLLIGLGLSHPLLGFCGARERNGL